MIETVTLRLGKTLFKKLDDGTMGRFQSMTTDMLLVQLEDHHGVFYKETLRGSINKMNEILAAIDIQIEYT